MHFLLGVAAGVAITLAAIWIAKVILPLLIVAIVLAAIYLYLNKGRNDASP